MDAQVTLDLKIFDLMRDEIKSLNEQIRRIDRALEIVHNTDRETICNQANQIEDSRNRDNIYRAVHTGEL